jgi:hypothetical protein
VSMLSVRLTLFPQPTPCNYRPSSKLDLHFRSNHAVVPSTYNLAAQHHHNIEMIRTKRRQEMTIFLFSNSEHQNTLASYTSRRTKQDTIRYSDRATMTINAAMTSFSFLGFTGWDPGWAGLSYYIRIGFIIRSAGP